MRHRFEFTFDAALIRAGMRRDLLWKGYVLGGILLALAGGLRWYHGSWDPWLTGTLLLGAAVVVGRFHWLLHSQARRVLELWTKQSPDRVIRYELDAEGFDVILRHSRSRHRWDALRRLWRYPDVWLFEIVKMQSLFVPPDRTPSKARDFIVERCRAAGVRV